MTTTTTKEDHPLIGPWSHSRATSCSLALYKDKVLRLPPEPRPERFMSIDRRAFGSCLHEGADECLTTIQKGLPWPNARDLTQSLLAKEEIDKDGNGTGVFPYAHLAPVTGEIEQRMELYANAFRVESDMTLEDRDACLRSSEIGHEMNMALQGDESSWDGDWLKTPVDGWRGVVDYAEDCGDGVLLIIDNKNRPAIFSKAELTVDEQLSGYAWLIDRTYPDRFRTFRVGIYYFEFGYTQIVDLSRDQMEANVARLKARAAHKASLKRSAIAPEPGFGKCQYCDYIASCPAGVELMAGGKFAPTDADAARQLAGWVMVSEERVKLARKALNVFTAEHGAVELDDKTRVGHAIDMNGVSYDKKSTLRILKSLITSGAISGKLSDFTSLDLKAVKKAAKSKDVDEALETARSVKVARKFDFFRPSKKKGVRAKKVGNKVNVHPDDMPRDFADDDDDDNNNDNSDRKTRARVRSGARKK